MPFIAGTGSVHDEEIYPCLVSLPAIFGEISTLFKHVLVNQEIIGISTGKCDNYAYGKGKAIESRK